MYDRFQEVNLDYVPNKVAGGVRLIIKLDKPEELSYKVGDKEISIDAATGQTEWGFQVLDADGCVGTQQDVKAMLTGQMEGTVVSLGGCCFHREGLTDLIDKVQVGTRIWFDQFSAKPLTDDQGRRTLYYELKEHHVGGVCVDNTAKE